MSLSLDCDGCGTGLTFGEQTFCGDCHDKPAEVRDKEDHEMTRAARFARDLRNSLREEGGWRFRAIEQIESLLLEMSPPEQLHNLVGRRAA